jgi:hypothetical protein
MSAGGAADDEERGSDACEAATGATEQDAESSRHEPRQNEPCRLHHMLRRTAPRGEIADVLRRDANTTPMDPVRGR